MIYRVDWLAMYIFARLEIVQKIAGRKRRRAPSLPRHDAGSALLKTELPIQEIGRRVRADGIAGGLRLNEDAVADVISFAARAPCYRNAERHRPLDRSEHGCFISADAVIGDYLDGIKGCDTVRRIWRDPIILAIARASLGTRPVPLRSRLWWSFRADRATVAMRAVYAQDNLHFDIDDWHAVKFFFYITAVGPENGPHIYVRGSHRNRAMLDQLSPFRSRSSNHIVAKYGRANFTVMHGPAGTGFVEDPYGFHTGTAVTGDARLILEIEYGVAPTPLVAGPFFGPFYVPAMTEL